MKILHLQENYLDNWTYQENILPQKQVELGNEVVLIASCRYPNYFNKQYYKGPNKYYDKKVKIIREEFKSKRHNLIINNLSYHLNAEQPDMIFLHGMQMLKNNSLMKYITVKRPKVVIDIHQDANNSHIGKGLKNKIKYFISKYYYRLLLFKYKKYIHKFFYISPSCKRFCEDFYSLSENELFPLYLGSDYELIDFENRENFRKKLIEEQNFNNDVVLVVFAGKIDKNKRIELLIDAFTELNIPNAYLLLAGSISDDYKKYIEKSLLNNNIRFLGWKSNKDLMELFLACDLGVYPGGQSVVWQQSLCCGLPCIYGYCEGVDYLNNGNAVILKNRTVEEMKNFLKDLISDTKKLKEMRTIALKYGNNKFNYLNIAKQSLQ